MEWKEVTFAYQNDVRVEVLYEGDGRGDGVPSWHQAIIESIVKTTKTVTLLVFSKTTRGMDEYSVEGEEDIREKLRFVQPKA